MAKIVWDTPVARVTGPVAAAAALGPVDQLSLVATFAALASAASDLGGAQVAARNGASFWAHWRAFRFNDDTLAQAMGIQSRATSPSARSLGGAAALA
jgi:hypothetical protein